MLEDRDDKPVKQSSTDRLDATTRAARQIIGHENAVREANTARLRAAREARKSSDAGTAK